jgi:hypothetical protein
MTKKQILQKHFTAEFGHDGHGEFMQYILNAMEEYAQQQVKNLNIPAVGNNEVAVAFGDWLRTQRADIFYGYPTTKKLFEMYKKATDC